VATAVISPRGLPPSNRFIFTGRGGE
jgi:hypothetical protein